MKSTVHLVHADLQEAVVEYLKARGIVAKPEGIRFSHLQGWVDSQENKTHPSSTSANVEVDLTLNKK